MDSLKVLEGKVEELLAQRDAAAGERDRLRDQLVAAQARSAEMAKLLEQLEEERTEVRTRVERILGRLDGLGLG